MPPLIYQWVLVESSFKYLGVQITGLTWALHTDSVGRKARQRLLNLRRLRKFPVSPQILRNFYT